MKYLFILLVALSMASNVYAQGPDITSREQYIQLLEQENEKLRQENEQLRLAMNAEREEAFYKGMYLVCWAYYDQSDYCKYNLQRAKATADNLLSNGLHNLILPGWRWPLKAPADSLTSRQASYTDQ